MKRICFIALLGIMAMGLASCGKDEVKTFYTVTFDADGGTPVPEVQRVEKGKEEFNAALHITKPVVKLSPSRRHFTLTGVTYERVEAPVKKPQGGDGGIKK